MSALGGKSIIANCILIGPRAVSKNPYYTTLSKCVQITCKTSTNIQRYSDSWLFVHLVICIVGDRFDKLTCAKNCFE